MCQEYHIVSEEYATHSEPVTAQEFVDMCREVFCIQIYVDEVEDMRDSTGGPVLERIRGRNT